MIDIRLKASEVRDTARSLHISSTTVLSELKEKAVVPALVNIALLCTLNPEKVITPPQSGGLDGCEQP